MGPVAYRDPAGAVSPDGRWLAYTQGRDVMVMSLAEGETRTLGTAPSQVRYLTWHPGSESLLVHERSFDRRRQDWFVYDIGTGAKETLWGGGGGLSGDLPPRSSLLELSWALTASRGRRRAVHGRDAGLAHLRAAIRRDRRAG